MHKRAAGGRGAILQFPVFFFLSFLLYAAAAAEEEEGRKCILRQCKKQSKFNDACPSFLFFPPFASSESQSAKRGKEKFLYFSEDIMEEGKKVFFFPPSAAVGKIDLSNFFLFFRVISFAFCAGNHCVHTLSRTESGKKKAYVILTTYTQKRHTKNGGDRCPLLTSNNPVRTTVPLILINIPQPLCVFSFVGVSCFPNNWKRRTQKTPSSPPLTPSSPLN